jgi:hypothetical protein
MATMVKYTTEEQRSVLLFFLWEKGLNAKDIHKEIFPTYGGKFLWRKSDQNWVEKRGKRFSDDK